MRCSVFCVVARFWIAVGISTCVHVRRGANVDSCHVYHLAIICNVIGNKNCASTSEAIPELVCDGKQCGWSWGWRHHWVSVDDGLFRSCTDGAFSRHQRCLHTLLQAVRGACQGDLSAIACRLSSCCRPQP